MTQIHLVEDGNSCISPFENRLWSFTYDVLLRFQCPIQFKVSGPNAPLRINQVIQFFVPKGREDVVEYIRQEWEHEVRIDKEVNGEWWWGTNILIYYFYGFEPYLQHVEATKLAHAALLYLKEKLTNEDSEITIDDCIPKEGTLQ